MKSRRGLRFYRFYDVIKGKFLVDCMPVVPFSVDFQSPVASKLYTCFFSVFCLYCLAVRVGMLLEKERCDPIRWPVDLKASVLPLILAAAVGGFFAHYQ
jgi:hypothetical protein